MSRIVAGCALCLSTVVLLLWITAFSFACVLLAWANVPAVIDTCEGFWEFMLASVLSPVIVPAVYIALGLGTIRWQAFVLVANAAYAVVTLVMTALVLFITAKALFLYYPMMH